MKLKGGYYHYVPMAVSAEVVKRIFSGEQSPLTKRSVPQATTEEREVSQGACVYGCSQGHAWLLFMVRESIVRDDGDRGRWLPLESADQYCVECIDVSDEEALGKRISATRHWTMGSKER